ncbi:MAG: response regulator transcription factor [Bacteroidetes bacterium]|nr:response regulator transcription factor [Bacteroidota bacterium]
MQHILIVEDHEGVSSFIKEGLTEEGFSAEIAKDGYQALDFYKKNTYDLILLDWSLPKMSGLEVCREIRKQNEQIPILFLTAKDTLQDTINGLRAGANDYIKKPFSFEELLERIKVHFRNPTDEPTALLQLKELTINTDTYQVFVENEEVLLTRREFDLLKYLVINKEKVCTREHIIRDVWNIHFEYDTGVIDVFMNAIRKKLGIKANSHFIKTIRGVGYMATEKS